MLDDPFQQVKDVHNFTGRRSVYGDMTQDVLFPECLLVSSFGICLFVYLKRKFTFECHRDTVSDIKNLFEIVTVFTFSVKLNTRLVKGKMKVTLFT